MRRRINAEKWHLWYTYQDLSGNFFNMFFTLFPFDHPPENIRKPLGDQKETLGRNGSIHSVFQDYRYSKI